MTMPPSMTDRLRAGLALCCLACPAIAAPAPAPQTETIVLLRHGEKPPAGLGQLSCQGLNRALALPPVLRAIAPAAAPIAIFAPDPAMRKPDGDRSYDYVRALATIEPTAIVFGLPVDTQHGLTDLAGLQTALEQPALHASTVLVSWEHHGIGKLARRLLDDHGAAGIPVPDWPGSEFDRLLVITLRWTGDAAQASMAQRQEGLHPSAACP